MIRYFKIAIVTILLSCSAKEQNDIHNWEISNTEMFEHLESGNHRYQLIYSIMNFSQMAFIDTSLIVKTYKDSLLLEEVHYNLVEGDTIKWSHHINRYNSENQLIEEIDSVNGLLQNHSLYFYQLENLVRSDYLFLFSNYNEGMELIGIDTLKSEVLSFYDEQGKCIKLVSLSKNQVASELFEAEKIDTTFTFNQFDEFNREVGSYSLLNRDTISMSRTEYDNYGRELMKIMVSKELGRITVQFKYDENGNMISELTLSDKFNELILTEFDEQNRPIKRETYRPNTLANNSYHPAGG